MRPVFKLTKEEKEIEKHLDDFVPVSKEEREKIRKDMMKIKKKRSITLRVNEPDLYKIKNMAIKEGLPYQTLISSILHKYADNQLQERDEAERYGRKRGRSR